MKAIRIPFAFILSAALTVCLIKTSCEKEESGFSAKSEPGMPKVSTLNVSDIEAKTGQYWKKHFIIKD